MAGRSPSTGAITSGAVGLLLGGALTEYLSWRWTLYVNLIFAAVAFAGGALLLKRQPSPVKPRLDIPGVLLVSGAVFCLISSASATQATHSWHAPSTWGFLAAGVALGAGFAVWQGRAAHPLLPPRVVLDRNRGGAYASMLIASAGLFGIFLFLTYYLQQTLGYSPLVTGVAFLPLSAGLILAANLSTTVLMPRSGAQAAGRVRDAGRGRRDGLAGSAGPAHRLCRGRARPDHPGRNRRGPGDRAGDQHRHLRRGPAGRGRRLRHRHRRPACSAARSAPRC